MKKVVLSLILLLSLNACAFNRQEFVNPIFSQPLRPLSRQTGYSYLTPTSIDFRTPLDEKLINALGQCELVENEQKHITLVCDITCFNPNDKEKRYVPTHVDKDTIITFTEKELLHDGCLTIEEATKYQNEKGFGSLSYYCVTPPENYDTSKSN